MDPGQLDDPDIEVSSINASGGQIAGGVWDYSFSACPHLTRGSK